MKPEWCPADLWERVAPYLDESRRYDATRGFLVNVARHHPDFDEFAFRELSSSRQDALLSTLLQIKKRKTKAQQEDKSVDR